MADSTDPNPTYQYVTSGDYQITLSVVSTGGCTNQVSKAISIYDAPLDPTDFSVSSSTTFCSNSALDFNYVVEAPLTGVAEYLWDFAGESTSTEQSPSYSFTTPGMKTVGLQVIIPGCSTIVFEKEIEIFEGPTASFTYTNNCFGEAVAFTDTSTGGLSNSWDYGDGSAEAVNESNPTHVYSMAGTYMVTLTVTNAAGCETVFTNEIEVSDIAIAGIGVGESVENLPVSFTGIDQTISDNSVVSWNWDFGGLGSSTLQAPSFTFDTPGLYTISLSVTTTQGCDATVMSDIEVLESICPTPSFEIPVEACIGEVVTIVNTSVNASNYEWNFCSGNLANMPESYLPVLRIGGGLPLSSAYESTDSGNYGFVTNRTSNSVTRMSFGNDYGSEPVLEELGNPSGLLATPDKIVLHEESGNWYGLVLSDQGDYNLTLLDFGNSLANDPEATNLGNPGGLLNRPRGMELHVSNDSLIAVITNQSNSRLIQLNFGSSITNVLSALDIRETNLSSFTTLLDITIGEECNNWYGFVCAQGNDQVLRLDFGASLFGTPVVTALPETYTSARRIDLIHDGESYKSFVLDGDGSLFRLDFTNGLSSAPVSTLLPNGFTDLSGLEIVNDTVGFMIDINSNELIRIDFGNGCSASSQSSTEVTPEEISYGEAGTYQISLRATNEEGNSVYATREITITNDVAPDIDFTIDDSRCLSNMNQFTSINTSGDIVSYSWDFDGDGMEDSTDPNPEFQYLTAGNYDVRLNVDAGGCGNSIVKSITIYPEPEDPSFAIIGSDFCIGDEIIFNNLSDESGLEQVISYAWNFNDEASSNLQNPVIEFTTSGVKQVSLQAMIPGCTTEIFTQELIINAPPEVDFDFTRVCAGLQTTLINVSPASNIVSYFWDFSDGFTSNIENPMHAFDSEGSYPVSFTITDDNGCTNTITKNVEVGQIPIPKISITGDLACSETILQFNDVTDNSVSNITTWNWQIESFEPMTGPNPQFTFTESGQYPLSFTITNDFGCMATLDTVINVDTSPQAQLSVQTACVGSMTKFFDETSGNIQSWFWVINGEQFFTQNPEVQFDEPGVYDVFLEVTSDNFCVATVSQSFEILALPIVDYTFSADCTEEQIRFEDNSQVFNDPIVSRLWDFGDNSTANGLVAFHQYSESGNYIVTLTLLTEKGCEINSVQEIIINESPVSGFEVEKDFGIPPFNVEISDKSTNAIRVDWFLDNQFINRNEEGNPSIPISESGLFNLKQVVTNEFGCKDSTEIQILSGIPAYDLILTDFEVIENSGNSTFVISVANNSNLPVSGFDINVSIDNKIIINEEYSGIIRQGEQIVYTLNASIPQQNVGFVCINVTPLLLSFPDINAANNEDCRNISARIEVSESYPNPSNEYSEINVVLDEPKAFNFMLTDLAGNILENTTFAENEESLQRVRVDLRGLSRGLYLMVLDFDGEKVVRRVVKN